MNQYNIKVKSISILKYNKESWALLGVMVFLMIFSALKLSETFIWICRIGVLIILYLNIKKSIIKNSIDKIGYIIFYILMAWLLIGFLRASNFAHGYWVWKLVMGQLLVTCFYIIILISTNIIIVGQYLRLYWLSFIPLSILSFINYSNLQQLNYMPYVLLIIAIVFVPNVKKWWLLTILLLFGVTFEHRNDMIKLFFAVCIGLLITYFYSQFLVRILKVLHSMLLILPLILLILGILGIFNVFKMETYIKGEYTYIVKSAEGESKRDFKSDTRTFIYENVFNTLNKYDALVWGRSPAFGDEGRISEEEDNLGLKGRYGNEVGIMDILLWYGVVGVALYFLLFLRASYVAVYQSNNRIAKGIGVYTAFIWLMSFIWEKPMFETFFMVDLILIGLCLSKSFRQLTDKEMQIWVRSIFTKQLILINRN